VILPGMCYRYEQLTARSEIQFYQLEGLAVGRNIRMSDLKGTITEYARRMFGANAAVRFRASYFPFTEPSMEVDVECFLCGGEGCRVCKYTGWLEIAGSVVHPTVLRNGGYDPTVWSGFAFGGRNMTMLRHDIRDIRYFWGATSLGAVLMGRGAELRASLDGWRGLPAAGCCCSIRWCCYRSTRSASSAVHPPQWARRNR
jgi:phenylalanyl-tRNA synthetase alpha chain